MATFPAAHDLAGDGSLDVHFDVRLYRPKRRLSTAAEQAVSGLRDALKRFNVVSENERNRVVVAATPMLSATVLPRQVLGDDRSAAEMLVGLPLGESLRWHQPAGEGAGRLQWRRASVERGHP